MAVTKKIKKTFMKVMEGESVSKAMIASGYSKNSAINPQLVTKSKGWKELMESRLSDSLLLKVHKEGLQAKINDKPDYSVRHKYLDTAYKIKGKFPKEGIGAAIQINFNDAKNEFDN